MEIVLSPPLLPTAMKAPSSMQIAQLTIATKDNPVLLATPAMDYNAQEA
jgi:hypothetical protein